MKRIASLPVLLLGVAAVSFAAPPRLIVVIGLDQFRPDYLVRFRDGFGEGGFRRLLDGGANFTAAAFTHANNVTGPGHAAMLSGSYGWTNGIVSNSWFDRASGKSIYCVEDPAARPVGGGSEGRSPLQLLTGTFGDQLREATGFRGRVISVALKDRAAILMGGKSPDGAYWFSDSVFVTSSYYRSVLPSWVETFNRSGAAQQYYGSVWDRLLPAGAYASMDVDDAPYEWGGNGLGRTFPHRIVGDDPQGRSPSYYQAMLSSPFGLDLLARFALTAIDSEQLGADDVPDLLCVSFSSIDYAGHAFGPDSHEMMDMVVRTDRMLAQFLDAIDRRVGLRNAVVVVTSDHGVTPIPEFLEKHAPALGARRIRPDRFRADCEAAMVRTFGEPPQGSRWILRLGHATVYLDRGALAARGIDAGAATRVLCDSMMRWADINAAVPVGELMASGGGPPLWEKFRRSIFPGRSGDLVYALRPYRVLDDGSEGADHGSPYSDDAHVPLLLFGAGIRPGAYTGPASPVDIAPTLSALTGINPPPGSEGRVLEEALQLP